MDFVISIPNKSTFWNIRIDNEIQKAFLHSYVYVLFRILKCFYIKRHQITQIFLNYNKVHLFPNFQSPPNSSADFLMNPCHGQCGQSKNRHATDTQPETQMPSNVSQKSYKCH